MSDATEELNRLMNLKPKETPVVQGGVGMPETALDRRINNLEKHIIKLENAQIYTAAQKVLHNPRNSKKSKTSRGLGLTQKG